MGAGIAGASTAWALRRLDPALRVALVEAETVAFGASGRNAGFLLLGSHVDYASAVDAVGRARARRLWRFTEENAALVRDLDGAAFDFTPSGAVVAAGDEAEAARLRRSTALLEADGVAAAFHEGRRGDAVIGGEGFHGALVISEGGALHPAKLVRHLAGLSGAALLEGYRVSAIEPSKAGVRLVTDAAPVEAERVVLCLNVYLPALLPSLSDRVRPVRAQMLATAPVAPLLDRPVYSHAGFFYLRQTADGRLLLGGARHHHAEAEVGYDDATTEALQADLTAYLGRHFPRAGAPEVERRWSGTMGFSPDGLPVTGAVPGVPEALFACGFSGHGMAFGLRFGLLLARQTLGLEDEAADLFAASRL